MNRTILMLIWISLFEIIGFCFGMVTKNNIPFWYAGLQKSMLTPPSITFSIVWTVLYAIIALVGFRLWENRHKPGIQSLLILYSIQVLLNWIWTPMFFQWHQVGLSLMIIVALTILTLIITVRLKKYFVYLSYLFFGYFLWLLFASYLNGVIYFLN